jgi:ABC-type phosphate/phosphonate transport system permease subunit
LGVLTFQEGEITMFENVNTSIPGWGAEIEPMLNMVAIAIVIVLLAGFVLVNFAMMMTRNQR